MGAERGDHPRAAARFWAIARRILNSPLFIRGPCCAPKFIQTGPVSWVFSAMLARFSQEIFEMLAAPKRPGSVRVLACGVRASRRTDFPAGRRKLHRGLSVRFSEGFLRDALTCLSRPLEPALIVTDGLRQVRATLRSRRQGNTGPSSGQRSFLDPSSPPSSAPILVASLWHRHRRNCP